MPSQPTDAAVSPPPPPSGRGAVVAQDMLPLEYAAVAKPASGFRWVILTLVFAAITINYIDRMVLGILADDLKAMFHISHQQYGVITSAFGLSYALGQAASGRWLDKIGTRVGYSIALLGWSIASMLHAFAR